MLNRMVMPLIVGGLALSLVDLTPGESLAQVDTCTDPASVIDFPLSRRDLLRNLEVGDCVAVGFPPAFRTLILSYVGIDDPDIIRIFSNEETEQRRFDTLFEVNGFVPVPDTGLTFIDDFGRGLRFFIDYTGASPSCITSVLNGVFTVPTISGPAEFLGIFELNGRLVAMFRDVTGTFTTDSVFGIPGNADNDDDYDDEDGDVEDDDDEDGDDENDAGAGAVQIPVSVTRRNFVLETDTYLDFEPSARVADFTPPAFCPPAP